MNKNKTILIISSILLLLTVLGEVIIGYKISKLLLIIILGVFILSSGFIVINYFANKRN